MYAESEVFPNDMIVIEKFSEVFKTFWTKQQ